MKKTISLITAIIITATTLLTGCANQLTPTNAPSVETEATTIETEVTEVTSETEPEVSLPSIRVFQQADKIVTDFMNELKTNVQNVDYEAFEAMYDRTVISDDMIKADWDYYYELFCGEKIFDIDCKAIAFSDGEIIFNTYMYWGIIKGNNSSYISGPTFRQFYLKYDVNSEKWVWSLTECLSDTLKNQIDTYYINCYGENAYKNGWCSPNYQLFHNRALDTGIQYSLKSAVLNEDGSVDIVIGVINGLDVNKRVYFDSGMLYMGASNDAERPVADLSYYKDNLSCNVAAKSIAYVQINIPKEKLLCSVEKQDLLSCCVSFNCNWNN